MRTYEAVMLFDPALEVEQIEADLRKLNDLMAAGGAVRKWERWGKRRLTYEIKGRQYGYYVVAVFDGAPAGMAALDRTMRIYSSIIRHLISVVEPGHVPELDAESVRTLGAAPESAPAAVAETDRVEIVSVENVVAVEPDSEAAEEPQNME
jgi:small subunit ribosomal protein S6